MSNVVQDKNEPNEEIMDVDANVAGTSMDLQRDTGENSTENSNVDLPEVSVALVPANQSNETPEHPPSPMPLEPTPSTSTGQGRRIFDDEGDSSDELEPRVKREKKKLKKLLMRLGVYPEGGPVSQKVPMDMILQMFPKLRRDPRIKLMHDSQTELPMRSRIMLFSNPEYLSTLSDTLFWGVDSSSLEKSVCGIHLFTVSKVIACCKDVMPLVYMVLPNKTISSYRRAFKAIQNATLEFHLPEILVVHLKKQNQCIFRAARSLYPNLPIKACFTFTAASFWKQARRRDVPEELITNPRTRNKLSQLLFLVFSPPSHVYQQFCEVTAKPFFRANHDVLRSFLRNFQRLYVGSGDGIRETVFPFNVWNYYDFFDTSSSAAPIDESISRMLVEAASPSMENFLFPIITYNSGDSDSDHSQ